MTTITPCLKHHFIKVGGGHVECDQGNHDKSSVL